MCHMWTIAIEDDATQWFRPVWLSNSDWFCGWKLPTAHTFFWYELQSKPKLFLIRKYPTKNYRSGKCWQSVFERVKKKIKKNIFWKNLKMYIFFLLQHLPLSSYSTPFVCFKTDFTLYVAPSKKKYAQSKVFPLMAGVNSHHPGRILNKKVSITLA